MKLGNDKMKAKKEEINHEKRKHALLSASGSSRWINCPGSVEAEKNYPRTETEFSKEGTLAHELADNCFKKGKDADSFIGKRITGEIISKDMARYVQEYIDYVRSHETKDSIFFGEAEVDFSHVVPEGFGTLDNAVLIPSQRICHIFDLKYGAGVLVSAFENTQGQLYALGILNDLGWLGDIDKFRIHIFQPRKENISYWDITVEELNQFGKYVEERAALALSKNAPRIPGEKQCEWCMDKANCKALSKFTENIIMAAFDEVDEEQEEIFKPVEKISDKEKKLILDNKDLIISFFNSIEKDVYDRLITGGEFKGMKLVYGKSYRVFKPNAEAFLKKELGSEAYEKKLIGITEAEKRIGKKKMAKITNKPLGKLTMVKSTDPRKAVVVEDVADNFEDLDDEL
ncbi:DUF2800 domain-containing protein [Candidatus Dependentiae bacterium]|nr:MAG: DUF2800 domain-containing protein [Candidatus Dependentiae bacterium]